MLGDTFSPYFGRTLKEASLSDVIMSAYLGGPITAASDVGGPTVVGSNTHLDEYGYDMNMMNTAVQGDCQCIQMRLINTAEETQGDTKV